MARKKRSIVDFANVAKGEEENNNVNANNNNNTNNNDDGIVPKQKYTDRLILKGLYIEHELAAIIDDKGGKIGRGGKSEIVNEALRIYFKDKGWM